MLFYLWLTSGFVRFTLSCFQSNGGLVDFRYSCIQIDQKVKLLRSQQCNTVPSQCTVAFDGQSEMWTFQIPAFHDDVIKWKHFPRSWPFVREFTGHRWIPAHKGQWRGALVFYLICASINGWVNNRESGDLRRHHAHYDVIVMSSRWIKGGKTCHLYDIMTFP